MKNTSSLKATSFFFATLLAAAGFLQTQKVSESYVSMGELNAAMNSESNAQRLSKLTKSVLDGDKLVPILDGDKQVLILDGDKLVLILGADTFL